MAGGINLDTLPEIIRHKPKTIIIGSAIGETSTPSIGKDDLLMVTSGSGSSPSLSQYSKKAKETGAKVALVTMVLDSEVSELIHNTFVVPAATKSRLPGVPNTIQPLGNQFDQSVHLISDAMIIYMLKKNHKNTHEYMRGHHTNLE